MSKIRSLLVALPLAFLAGSPSFAGDPCAYSVCWGAVAVGSNGAYGYSFNYPEAKGASDRARAGCEGNCNVVKTFKNACAAIAVGDRGRWGWSKQQTRALAETAAVKSCASSDKNCKVRVWACSKPGSN